MSQSQIRGKGEQVYLYILSDPRTGEIRYVGKTDNIKRRLKHHIDHCYKGNARRQLWVRELVDLGLKPVIEKLEIVHKIGWEKWEIYWIDFFRKQGVDLVNTSRGGGRNTSTPWTEERKAKFSNIQKGKVVSPETRAKISEALRGIPISPEARLKILGRHCSDKTRAKISASNNKRSISGVKGITHCSNNGGWTNYWKARVRSRGKTLLNKLFPYTDEGLKDATLAVCLAYNNF